MSLSQTELQRRFEQPPDPHAALRAAKAAVVDWIWARAGSDRWHAEPLWSLRNGFRAGRDYKAPPKHRDHVERYGYDRAGRLRVAERFEFGEVQERLIVERDGDLDLRWNFDSFGALRTLTCSTLEADTERVLHTRLLSRIGSEDVHVAQTFSYDEQGRVTRVRFDRSGGDYEHWPALQKGEQRITNDHDGQPTKVVADYDDPAAEPETVYERIVSGWDELADAVRPALVEAIARAVSTTTEQIALLALYYTTDAAAIPPLVYVCSDRERKELIARFGRDRAVLLPGEWEQEPLELRLPNTVNETCKELRGLVAQEVAPEGAPRQLTLSLATALAAYKWPPSLSRTNDFAVYAVDAEGEELERNLAASVSERQRALWRRQGVLGTTPHESAPSNGR